MPVPGAVFNAEVHIRRQSDNIPGSIAEAFAQDKVAFVVDMSDLFHYVNLKFPLASRRRPSEAQSLRRGGTTSMVKVR